jgi:type I restriction enzyme, S subunit
MIPDGWEAGKIKDLIKSLDAGVSVNSENKSIQNGEIGVLKVSAVSYGKFLPSEHKVVLTEELHRLTIYPKKDRILISRANTPDLVGASVYIDRDYPNLFLPDKLWQTEPRHNNFSLKWLSYLISSDDYRLKISSHATGTSMSMKNISKVDLLNIEIIIPPLLEQCRIAEVLGVWDESIDLLEKLIGRVRSRKQGLMQQLLTGKKRFKEFEGSEWKTVRLSEIAKTSSGGTPPSNNLLFYGGDIPWVSISDMTSSGKYLYDTERKLTDLGLQNSSAKIYPIGTILFAMYASIGKCSIAKVFISCSQAILGVQLNEDLVNTEFIYYFLTSQETKCDNSHRQPLRAV